MNDNALTHCLSRLASQVILILHQRMKATEREQETINKWQAVQASMHEAAGKAQVRVCQLPRMPLMLLLPRVRLLK